MPSLLPPATEPVSRRRFLKASVCGAAGLALYSTAIERHWIEISHHDFVLRGLPAAFEGVRMVQLSDIHLDLFTEPFFLRHAIDCINRIRPEAIFLTGDFVTAATGFRRGPKLGSVKFARDAAWQCANMLTKLECKALYAVLGNHDLDVGADVVAAALTANGINVLRNAYTPIERAGDRIWLAGVDDPLEGHPDPESAIPASIRNVPNEPVVLMCHAPDYVDRLLTQPAGQAVDLVLSGHTHGGQVRLPLVGAMVLPVLGRKYIEGLFRFGRLQLFVNRGLGTVGVPFRLDCPPEITVITLRTAT